MIYAVRCSSCQNLSRVGGDALGQMVGCPHCGISYVAEAVAETSTVATPNPSRPVPAQPTRARPRREVPVVYPTKHESHGHDEETEQPGPKPILFGIALLPFGVPLLWLIGPFVGIKEPVFSFATPVALAVGLAGLCLGIAYAAAWKTGTKIKAMMMLILLGYGTAGFLYFIKKEWAQEVRKHIGPPILDWKDFQPPDDKAYKVSLPGIPKPVTVSPLPNWPLKSFRIARDEDNRNEVLHISYEMAHGSPAEPVAARAVKDDDWFAAVRTAVLDVTQGEITAEREIKQDKHMAREYTLTLPDGATNRIVRVIRVRTQNKAYYLAVEGAFIPADAKYVRKFLDSFTLTP